MSFQWELHCNGSEWLGEAGNCKDQEAVMKPKTKVSHPSKAVQQQGQFPMGKNEYGNLYIVPMNLSVC